MVDPTFNTTQGNWLHEVYDTLRETAEAGMNLDKGWLQNKTGWGLYSVACLTC